MIKLDRTRISVVVTCTDCPWWHGFGLDDTEAWATGKRHQERHHPGEQQAAKALAKARNRQV